MAGESSVTNLQYIETEKVIREVERSRDREVRHVEGMDMDTGEEITGVKEFGLLVQILMQNLVKAAGREERVFSLGR